MFGFRDEIVTVAARYIKILSYDCDTFLFVVVLEMYGKLQEQMKSKR